MELDEVDSARHLLIMAALRVLHAEQDAKRHPSEQNDEAADFADGVLDDAAQSLVTLLAVRAAASPKGGA